MIALMPDSTEQETVFNAAQDDTEIVVVDYPETPLAWSEEIMRPAVSDGFRFRSGVKYAALAVVALGVVWLMAVPMRPHPQAARPVPAPPAATPTQWKPTPALDDQYIQALRAAGWIIDDQQIALANAHWSCTFLSQGHSKADLVGHWDQTGFADQTPAQNHNDDEQWMGIVISNMCPQFN